MFFEGDGWMGGLMDGWLVLQKVVHDYQGVIFAGFL